MVRHGAVQVEGDSGACERGRSSRAGFDGSTERRASALTARLVACERAKVEGAIDTKA